MNVRNARRTEYALWLVGAVCLMVYAATEVRSAHAQAEAFAQVEHGLFASRRQSPNTTLWSARRIAHYNAEEAKSLSPLGVLSIPAVDVAVAVFNGTSDRILNLGAGRVRGTAQTASDGNLAIAAHRDGFFRGLKDIQVGDALLFKDEQGVHSYTVTELVITDPEDVSVLEESTSPVITLITCYPFYFVGSAPQRFIVRAEQSTNQSN